MGWAKRQLEKGYSQTNEYICSGCIGEEFLASFISDNESDVPCSYCDSQRSVPLSDIIELILAGFEREYTDPANGVYYESKEGGYLGVEGRIWDTGDLLWQYLDLEEEPYWDILLSISQDQWVYTDPYGLQEHEEFMYTWEAFSNIVKHTTRYVFFRSGEEDTSISISPIQPVEILDSLARMVDELDMVEMLPKRFEIIRGRSSRQSTGKVYTTAEELGAPKHTHAQTNRMSPAGIPMFYGATDEETVSREIVSWNKVPVTFATWNSVKPLCVLNLDKLPDIPSLFDEDRNHNRPYLRFLHDFRDDFSKVVKKDQKEHVEYVPTQIVTEYFRRVYKTPDGKHLDGIAYTSSVSMGTCYVFFCGPEGCCDNKGNVNENTLLFMDTKSVRTIMCYGDK